MISIKPIKTNVKTLTSVISPDKLNNYEQPLSKRQKNKSWFGLEGGTSVSFNRPSAREAYSITSFKLINYDEYTTNFLNDLSPFPEEKYPLTILEDICPKNFNIFVRSIRENFRRLFPTTLSGHDSLLDQFILDNSLQDSLAKIDTLIKDVFGPINKKRELYMDTDEPEYKYVKISILPSNDNFLNMEDLLDKYDILQDRFADEIPVEYSSKIVFHLSMTNV